MRRRQTKKKYKKIVNNLRPLTDFLTTEGWSFNNFGDKLPIFRNGKALRVCGAA